MSLRWTVLLGLVGLVWLGAGPARAGIDLADPDELIKLPGLRSLQIYGRVIAVGWRGHQRSLPPRPLAHPQELADLQLDPPAGDWTDVVLVVDGPVTLRGETLDGRMLQAAVTVDRIVAPLDDPDARGPLELVWPTLDGSESAAELRAALQDGLGLTQAR